MKNFLIILLFLVANNIVAQKKISVDEKLDKFLIESGIFHQRKNYLFEYSIKPLKGILKKTTDVEWKEFEDKLTDKELLRLFREPYKKVFTEYEIDEFTKFYTSETGKKLLAKSEEIEFELNKNLAWIPIKVEEMIQREQMVESKKPVNKQPAFAVDKESGFYKLMNTNHQDDFSKFVLEKNPSVLISHIDSFEKRKDDLGRFIIDIQLNAEGALKFHQLSYDNIGKPIAIVLDKKIIMAPIINEPIPTGRIQISGNFSEKEINDLVKYLEEITNG